MTRPSAPYEVPDFHPETGHLHTCNGRGRCGCLLALYAEAERLNGQVSDLWRWVRDTGCTCPKEYHYASLPDHENTCPAQVEWLLTVPRNDRTDGAS